MKLEQINDIRNFNRFYSKVIGLLDKTYLNSAYSIAEVRVICEISCHSTITANDILTTLGLDKGYLSRILKSFEKKKLIIKERSATDGRVMYLKLTELGRSEFEKLDKGAATQVSQAFGGLSEADYNTLIESMKTIKTILIKK
jgi:DNA-binding MarR family transcriptional regulator